ncbi:tRNA dihydrouridine(20/20a) synthase DusA [Rhizobium sp. RU20A]|uniref:tRNA dihydrouridine(20/20a) synthase DusA n=1 Tax=Rhizobium sp. RU20A TaxID=1907412 RepID=UPI00122C7429|nr:tRNA dihydrouridine(20/20a) synthase DusA [Rhizobium sp. RU20A]
MGTRPANGALAGRYFRAPVFAVAPMIDWTDTHFRVFARQMSRHALLYTEMIVADAVLRGDRQRLLGFDPCENPLALQLGGNDPQKLAEAARIGAGFGYDEINMNVGCPSDRVQSGTFGACLMREPAVVADCVAAMKAAVSIPVTVKCRIGVDDQEPEEALFDLVAQVKAAGADAVWVHARKAWLQGLSPKENRDIPPLDYAIVHRLKAAHPDLFIGLNGGLKTLAEGAAASAGLDGMMLGRAAYQDSGLLAQVDAQVPHPLTGAPALDLPPRDADFWRGVSQAMQDHAVRHIERGGRLIHVTRHMVGLFQGLAGAKRYRQILSSEAARTDAGPEVIARAFEAVLVRMEETQADGDGSNAALSA